jgi:type IV pilus assembly protein PilP
LETGVSGTLVKVDNLIYRARWQPFGQNYGLVKVTETGISLREIVQDAAGE